MIGNQLTGEEFEDIRDKFISLDTDGDGKLTKEELKFLFSEENENRNDDEFDYMMKMMDLDSSSTIEFTEFLEMFAFFEYNKAPYKVHVTQMFKAFDKNDDGFVSLEEITQLWNIFTKDCEDYDRPSEEEIADNFKTLDINGDGKVDYNEFLEMFDFDQM